MGAAEPPAPDDRLHLIDAVVGAAEDSLSSAQRLFAEVRHQMASMMSDELGTASNAELIALRREVEQLREGMASRAIIERAKGILMHRFGLTESQAFQRLQEMSQRTHRKVRDVAADIARGYSGARPTPGWSPDADEGASPSNRILDGSGMGEENDAVQTPRR